MIYRYILYDYIIETNRFCKYLKSISEKTFSNPKNIIKIEISNTVAQTKVNNDRIFRYKYTEKEMIGNWHDISFYMHFSKHYIRIYSDKEDDAFLFILNVPVSILLAYDNKIVFHSSNVLINNNIYSFSGPKGAGKSTTTAILSLGSENVTSFSDDTICIDVKNSMICSNYYVEKYTQNTLDLLNYNKDIIDNSLDYKNNKYLKPVFYDGGLKELSSLHIYYLFRSDKFQSKVITNIYAKIDLFLRNIVGIKYFNKDIKNQIEDSANRIFYQNNFECQIIHMPEINVAKTEEIRTELLHLLI